MKQPYERPVFRAFTNKLSLAGDQAAALDDEHLRAYLMDCGVLMKEKRFGVCTDRYVYRRIAEEAVLVPIGEMAGGQMIILNETAALLFDLMEQRLTLREIIHKAREAYLDPQGRIENQIFDCIDQYLKAGIIREEIQ